MIHWHVILDTDLFGVATLRALASVREAVCGVGIDAPPDLSPRVTVLRSFNCLERADRPSDISLDSNGIDIIIKFLPARPTCQLCVFHLAKQLLHFAAGQFCEFVCFAGRCHSLAMATAKPMIRFTR